ncbi:MAG: hypothetical protein ACPG5T_06640, partial [Endozoicomonas sp.]
MSKSIRQKITLYTLLPAVAFYSVVTIVFLYYAFKAVSSEISRKHLYQAQQYVAVIEGNAQRVLTAGKALSLGLDGLINHPGSQASYLKALMGDTDLVTGVGLINYEGDQIQRGKIYTQYWLKTNGEFHESSGMLPFSIPVAEVVPLLGRPSILTRWYVNTETDRRRFQSSLLVSVPGSNQSVVRLDIDGAKLTEPLVWNNPRTRLMLLDPAGNVLFTSGITLPKYRTLDEIAALPPCKGFGDIHTTVENENPVARILLDPIRPSTDPEPCGIYREAIQRVSLEGKNINYRSFSRSDKRWVTAMPVPSTRWYFGLSMLERDVLAPVIRLGILGAFLIGGALLLTLGCLWG